MYLSKLSNQKRHMFRDLEIYISKIDGEFNDLEKNIINTHCIEMRIDNNNYENELPYDELLVKLKNECSLEEKRIIFIELSAVALADNVFNNVERKMIEHLAKIFDINSNDIEKAIDIISRLKIGYENFSSFVFGQGE